MTSGGSAIDGPRAAAPTQPGTWAWHPPLPLDPVPVFVWPPRPVAAFRYLVSLTFLGSIMAPFGVLAALSWFHLQPALERCAELRADWILQMYARNLALMLLVAGRTAPLVLRSQAPGRRTQVRPPKPEQERPQVLRAQPGMGQHAVDVRERRHRLDGLRSGLHVGIRKRPGAVLSPRGRAPGVVRPHAGHDPVLGFAALLFRAPPPALEASVPARARVAPPKRQRRTLVWPLDAPHRTPGLPEQRARSRGVRIAPDPHPLPHAVEHAGSGDLAHRGSSR